MAITTDFTNLKGDTGDTGDSIVVENLVQSSVAGSDTTFDLVQKDASGSYYQHNSSNRSRWSRW